MKYSLPLVLLLVGCNSKDSTDLTQDAKKLAESGSRSLVNATLAAKVTTALSLRKGVDVTKLSVESDAGSVTLSGEIATKKEKLLILEIARETRGVEKLIDKTNIAK